MNNYELIKKYEQTISFERLSTFIYSCDDNLSDIINRYKNNIRISQALYPELSILEITLRNAINYTLCKYLSKTWIKDELSKQKILLDHEYELLIKAYKDSEKDKFAVERIIANLNLGFWTSICSKKYNDKIWTKKGYFRNVFVNYPINKKQQIHEIALKLNSIRKLRNRIFHYEPIFQNPNKLLIKYNEILEILSYLPKDNLCVLEDTSNFLKVYDDIINNRIKC